MLIADAACWQFKIDNPEEWETFGCGPGGVGDMLVPDTMWGLNINEACRVHDWYYRMYPDRSEEARKSADQIMHDNAVDIVNNADSGRILRFLRRLRCKTYFHMVRNFGKSSWNQAKGIRDK